MSRKFDFYKVKSRDIHEIFMKSSKHVKTCFVSANDDFGDKLTYIYCFLHENKFWTKIPQNEHCGRFGKYWIKMTRFKRSRHDFQSKKNQMIETLLKFLKNSAVVLISDPYLTFPKTYLEFYNLFTIF